MPISASVPAPADSSPETRARALIFQAKTQSDRQNHLEASRLLQKATAVLQEVGPCELLADTLRSISFEHWYHKRGLKRAKAKERHAQLMVSYYEQAIAVWEKLSDPAILGGNLTNLSAMYYQLGQFDIALARAQRGLEIEKAHSTEGDPERVSAWTHVAGAHIELGQLDEAEAVVQEARTMAAHDDNALSYLYDLMARIHDKRAEGYRKLSRELRPGDACHL